MFEKNKNVAKTTFDVKFDILMFQNSLHPN